jgi:hypothetical protein
VAKSLIKMANNVGKIKQPCLTPHNTGNKDVKWLSTCMVQAELSYKDLTAFDNLPFIPYFCNLYHKQSLLTLSNAFSKSMKHENVERRESLRSFITE